MYTRDQVADAYLDAVAKAFMKDYDYIRNNRQLNIHTDLHCESIHSLAIAAVLEEELDFELDTNEFIGAVSTLESGIDYILGLVNA